MTKYRLIIIIKYDPMLEHTLLGLASSAGGASGNTGSGSASGSGTGSGGARTSAGASNSLETRSSGVAERGASSGSEDTDLG